MIAWSKRIFRIYISVSVGSVRQRLIFRAAVTAIILIFGENDTSNKANSSTVNILTKPIMFKGFDNDFCFPAFLSLYYMTVTCYPTFLLLHYFHFLSILNYLRPCIRAWSLLPIPNVPWFLSHPHCSTPTVSTPSIPVGLC